MYNGHPDQRFGPTSFSQSGEDIFFLSLLKSFGIKPNEVTYLDLGAHHPEHISNTKLMYNLGAHGINVEANPILINEFIAHRPNDINIEACVTADQDCTQRKFYMVGQNSGRNTFSKAVADELVEMGYRIERVIGVNSLRLDTIVQTYAKGVFPYFLNVDLEGLDYEVLASSEILKIENRSPLLICVEVNPGNSQKEMVLLLEKLYFAYYTKIHHNLIFIRRDYLDYVAI